MSDLVLSCSNGSLGLLDDDLLGLTLLPLQLQRLPSLQLDLPWLHQLDLSTNKNEAGDTITATLWKKNYDSVHILVLQVFWYPYKLKVYLICILVLTVLVSVLTCCKPCAPETGTCIIVCPWPPDMACTMIGCPEEVISWPPLTCTISGWPWTYTRPQATQLIWCCTADNVIIKRDEAFACIRQIHLQVVHFC